MPDPPPDAVATSPHRPSPPQLTAFWDLALDVLELVSPDGTLLHVNPAYTGVLGWPPDEVVGRHVFELLHPDDVDATREAFARLRHGGEAVHDFENRCRTRDGRYRTMRWNARTSMDGEVVHAAGRDVTDMYIRIEALRLSEERFRQAMTSAAIGMALVGLDGRFVDVNDALCRIVGRPREVLTTLTFQDITHPDDVDVDVGLAQQLLDDEIDHYDLEKRYLRPDGNIVWVLLTGSLVRTGSGEPQHFIAQVQDITVRKHAEEELARTMTDLRRSNETLAEFAAVAAHDLKSPLAIASSYIDLVLLHGESALSERDRNMLGTATTQLRRLSHQVDGLLRIAAVTGRYMELTRTDPAAVIADVRDVLAGELELVALDVEPLAAISADRSAMGLLFQNLLANAAKHGASRMRISSTSEQGMVRFFIDDDGPGIAIERREEVFELFKGDSRQQRSTGLGLALCRRIVERHGGEIHVEDSPLGGARLAFLLPAA